MGRTPIHQVEVECIEHLAAQVAHDVNNILTKIMGRCELLQLRLGPDDPLCRDIDRIKEGIDEAAARMEQLLPPSAFADARIWGVEHH